MIKRILVCAMLLSATPAMAGSIGSLTGTTTTTITGGTRAVTINGSYSSEEHTVSSGTDGTGATASATWDPTAGPVLTTAGTGGLTTNTAYATYSTNAVTAATYLNDAQHSYTGTESVTTAGVFFNY